MTKQPYRVVDRHNRGWHLVGPADGPLHYDADYGFRDGLTGWPLDRIAGERGPCRPVVPPTDEEDAVITGALQAAGTKAVGTLLVALFRIAHRAPSSDRLTAGRGGSWEAEALKSAVWGLGCDLAEKPRRVHADAAAALDTAITDWVANPDRYVEVAETLASLVGQHADTTARGWADIADRWLQPDARLGNDSDEIESVRGWLLSTSAKHGPFPIEE